MVSGQFAGESFEEEINEELDALLAAQMPEVPADKIPEATQERTKKGNLKKNIFFVWKLFDSIYKI